MWPFKKKDVNYYENVKEKEKIKRLYDKANTAGDIIDKLKTESKSEEEFKQKLNLFIELAGKDLKYMHEEKDIQIKKLKAELGEKYIKMAKNLDERTLTVLKSFSVERLEHIKQEEE